MKKLLRKALSVFLAISILTQCCFFSNKTYALTGGPSSPEFSNFESVSTTNMVDPFTGAFTYNIPLLEVPGPNGGGYPLSLSYHSGVTQEDDASWVGFGWTLNPGAIIRNKRGLADDLYYGDVTYYNKMPKNTTFSLTATETINLRAFGIPSEVIKALIDAIAGVGVGITSVLAYNNYKGLTLQNIPYISYHLGWKNTTISVNPGITDDDTGVRYSYSKENPIMYMISSALSVAQSALSDAKIPYNQGLFSQLSKHLSNNAQLFSTSSSRLQGYSLGNNSFPGSLSEYVGNSYTFSAGVYLAPSPIPIGIGATLSGSYVDQTVTEEKVRYGYGYLYSDVQKTALSTANVLLDFSVEKEEDYNLRDELLPIPYSSADDFIVVGEGVSGSMRAYSSAPGEFFPAYTHSHSNSAFFGSHVTVGATESYSTDVSASDDNNGGHNISIGKWDDANANDDYAFWNDGAFEKYYFRFKGDMGGSASFTDNDALKSAKLSGSSGYEMNQEIYKTVNDGEGVNRSTFVGYHTNEQMLETDTKDMPLTKYSLRSDIDALTDRGESSTDNLDKRIGEFEVTNKQGIRYVYGLPLYAKNEKQISFSVDASVTDHIVYANENNAERKFGHETKDRYASSFLLTEVTTPDYIDVDHNGPDADDFGGWTKFNYTKTYGEKGTESTAYYHWRNPYRGLTYIPGDISNAKDDLGSYESGDREVAYVSSIETATHIAVFELNDNSSTSTEKRTDGLSAADDASANTSSSAQGTQRLHYLKTIKLYAKDEEGNQGELIKTVHFEYDNSLVKGQPNSDGANGSNGKRTLTKIWFEYANVHNTGISPYTFEYAYPTDITYPSPFGNETNDTLSIVSDYAASTVNQNPDYNADNSDVWGMYQENGTTNHYENYFPWVDQATPSATFDPAAWHLKRIKLPTGAEIHVQYEQNDYNYVQDRKAMEMVSISGVEDYIAGDEKGAYGAKYFIDTLTLNALGIATADTAYIIDYIKENFINNGKKNKKMYFKFLYNLSETSCGQEYITGYANVMAVGSEYNGSSYDPHYRYLYIQLGNPGESEGNGSPCEACQEYYRANKGIKVNDCDNTMDISDDQESAIMSLFDLVGDITDKVGEDNCKSFDTENGHSYLRIPLPHAKKGGGVRVKRLLTYDPGIETDNTDKRVYGNEYIYQTEDGESSGVAANEPNREENALIGYLQKRSESSSDQVMVSGEDRKQFEGPVGEYLLPGPTIGYSRVVSKNIYSGTTNNGFSVNTFYTAKDYPYDWTGNTTNTLTGVDFTDLGLPGVNYSKEESTDFAFFVNKTKADYKAIQGYRFVIPNMHGKPKVNMQYDGAYAYINDPTQCSLLASTEYNYFEPGEEIPTLTNYTSSGPVYGTAQLGKEDEIVCYSKKVEETVREGHASVEAGIMLWTPYEIPYAIPFYFQTNDDSYIQMHITNHILYFPPVVKSVTNYIDGTYHVVSNKYFDAKTGDVLVQESSGNYDQMVFDNKDAHEGKYDSYNFPAHFYYDGMGQKAGSEGYSFTSGGGGITATKGLFMGGPTYSVVFSGSKYSDVTDHFAVGDLIELNKTGNSTKEIYNITSIYNEYLFLTSPTGYASSSTTDGEVELTIIKSGKANLLTTMAGSLTTYGIEDDSVLNASAATYTDTWTMESELKDTYGATSTNKVETGEVGKWHLQNTYSFWGDISGMSNAADKAYDAGIIQDFKAFNWSNTSSNSSKWKNINTATSYTPNGNACEEKNLYDIYSCNKMGYGGGLVYLAAQNAEYLSTLFESFEYNGGEEITTTSSTLAEGTAHSGNNSLKVSTTAITATVMVLGVPKNTTTGYWGAFNLFDSRERTDQLKSVGLSVKIWVKAGDYIPTIKLRDASAYNLTVSSTDGSYGPAHTGTDNFSDVTFTSIARTGEWTLYEAKITPSKWADFGLHTTIPITDYGLQVYMTMDKGSSAPSIYIDDIRVQPLNAKMESYVYDPATYKVVASFDDQNFGLFYQYNDEGQLVRKEKETIKGVKTLMETEYHTPTESR